ncbi:MAG: hypothetical protein B7X08_00545 [Acidocella sp. 20-63-7]|nr:MAG: hypothetical protein B7X08_00545 [Acidocella sp. 20-63-7]
MGVLVLLGVVIGLHGALKRVGLGDVLSALAGTPRSQVYHALMLLGGSFGLMMLYDAPGVVFAKRGAVFAPLGPLRIALASFCAYALSHVLGAPALSAAAIRLRLYAQWQVPPAGIARIVTFSGTMFTIGLMTLLGVLLLAFPENLPLFGHEVAPWALRALGGALALAILFYVLVAQKLPGFKIFGHSLTPPGRALALTQVLLSCCDISTACAILYAVLPDTPGLSYPHVLGVYLAAFAGGIFSGLPGGIGVFDSVLLLGLSVYMPPAAALGAILLFRVLYFIVPACVAALVYAGHELWLTTRRTPAP